MPPILTKKPAINTWALLAGTQGGHQHPRFGSQIHFNCSRENELCQAFVLSAAGKRQLSLATIGVVDAVLPNGDLDGIIIITLRREMTIMPRETFDEQIGELQEDLLALGDLVDKAIERSIQSLANRDLELAQQIIDEDALINRAQRDLEERCLVLIATQQPLASDLRIIIAVSNIAIELERMGDYAKGIAKITLMIGDQPLLKPLIDVPRMAEKGRQLLHQQLDAFIRRDPDSARRLGVEDDEVDALYDQVYRELLFFMTQDPKTITRATHLLWVAHNLERISDRTTNIGERVVFLVTGQVEELNLERLSSSQSPIGGGS